MLNPGRLQGNRGHGAKVSPCNINLISVGYTCKVEVMTKADIEVFS
jgi:hypothetical protein